MGRRPVVLLSDPEAVKQVLQKDFPNFSNRMVSSAARHALAAEGLLQLSPVWSLLCPQKLNLMTKPMSDSLLCLRDEQWKRVRSVLTPSFSAARMKEVSFPPGPAVGSSPHGDNQPELS